MIQTPSATGPGGIVPDGLPQGSTIARAAGTSSPGITAEWVVSAAATPGSANPAPTVSVMLPLSGAILDPGAADLFWYPVPGASSYRVQVATEETVRRTGDGRHRHRAPGECLRALPQAHTSGASKPSPLDGTQSDFSEPADFELASAGTASAQARLATAAWPWLAADTPGKHLSVPLIGQHKDTAMLLLERNVETGPHPWDADHQSLGPTDPADNKNCALASIAMVSAFYGGGLSQDRIGYEVISHRTGNPQGPEGDLMYGYGTDGQEALDVLKWALGDVTYPGLLSFEDMWNTVVREIDAGRPIVAANSHHAFVITGYEVTGGRRLISINDPWPGRTYKQDIDRVKLPASDFNFFLMPATPNVRHQEASRSPPIPTAMAWSTSTRRSGSEPTPAATTATRTCSATSRTSSPASSIPSTAMPRPAARQAGTSTETGLQPSVTRTPTLVAAVTAWRT